MEVLEVEDLYTSSVPTKIMGSSLRHTKSEENLAGGEQTNNRENADGTNNGTNFRQPLKGVSTSSHYRNVDVTFTFPDEDPNEIWSQEDDDITQQVIPFSNKKKLIIKCFFFFMCNCFSCSIFTSVSHRRGTQFRS